MIRRYARMDSAYHRDVPCSSVGEVLDTRQLQPLGPPDFLVRWPNGVEKWMSGYHVSLVAAPKVANPRLLRPSALDEWLDT